MNASGKENARCLDSDSDHISQCTHPQVTSYLVSSKPNSLAHCRQTTLNVVATGCVEAALPSFVANHKSAAVEGGAVAENQALLHRCCTDYFNTADNESCIT